MYKVMKFYEVANLITCGIAKRPDYVEQGYMFLSSKNVKTDKIILEELKYISDDDYKRLTKYSKPEKGDLLYSRVGSFGEAAVIDFDLEFAVYVSLTLIKLKKDLVFNRYIMHFLNSPRIRDFAKNNTTGIGVQNLNVEVVRNYDIYVPPLKIQHKIANILDKTQFIINQRKEQIVKLDEFLQSVFLDMFGDPISNKKEMTVTTVGELAQTITKGESIQWQGETYVEVGIPFIRTVNVTSHGVDLEKCVYITDGTHNRMKRSQLQENDILISIAGTLGRCANIPKAVLPANINQDVAIIRIQKENINIKYLVWALQSNNVQEQIRIIKRGAGRLHLNLQQVKSLTVLLPPPDLQNKFAQIVDKAEEQKVTLQKSLAEMENLFSSLVQKAFRGELFQ